MTTKQLIECVPNFSEGRDMSIIKEITDVIESVEGVQLLDVDPGKATNRTVVTFVGEPAPVVQAAFLAIRKASELIDMSKHHGEHPRMGATDVCPLVPVANISLEEVAEWAHKLGEMAGQALDIPFYMYERAATSPERRNLASVRAGEYEALPDKLKRPEWKPDYGPARFNARAGATAIGARDFLIAYNINLNTTSVRRANSVAFDVREKGRVKREGDPVTGTVVLDQNGEPVRVPGTCKAVKGIGWYIEEYGIAQISMNLTDIRVTPLHVAFEACCKSAEMRGLRVTGSELVGLVPKRVLLDAARYFLRKQERSVGLPEEALIHIAVRTLGLDELAPFDPKKKVIEYLLEDPASQPLIRKTLPEFTQSVAAETPTPGGGSVSAYVGALGASLGGMVANLSGHKRGWDDRWEFFSNWAAKAQDLQDALLRLVDEDTLAFNRILDAFRLPKGNDAEKYTRMMAIEAATRYAIEVPLQVMERCAEAFDLMRTMVHKGNPNSLSDAAVGMLCIRTALRGAFLNVQINLSGLKDKDFAQQALNRGRELDALAAEVEAELMVYVESKL